MSQLPRGKALKRSGALACLLAALLTAGCGASPDSPPAPERRQFSGALASRRIELPADDTRFPEPAGALLNRNCLSCHSTTMILYQPRLTEAQWQAAVAKMRDTYKAPIAEGEVAGIVRELVALNAGTAAGR
jgi:hypothetical protein